MCLSQDKDNRVVFADLKKERARKTAYCLYPLAKVDTEGVAMFASFRFKLIFYFRQKLKSTVYLGKEDCLTDMTNTGKDKNLNHPGYPSKWLLKF